MSSCMHDMQAGRSKCQMRLMHNHVISPLTPPLERTTRVKLRTHLPQTFSSIFSATTLVTSGMCSDWSDRGSGCEAQSMYCDSREAILDDATTGVKQTDSLYTSQAIKAAAVLQITPMSERIRKRGDQY
eukprot:2507508-Amphidinium_carterae.1